MREREIKGEFDGLPPIEELQIVVPEVLCDPLGEVGEKNNFSEVKMKKKWEFLPKKYFLT